MGKNILPFFGRWSNSNELLNQWGSNEMNLIELM